MADAFEDTAVQRLEELLESARRGELVFFICVAAYANGSVATHGWCPPAAERELLQVAVDAIGLPGDL